MLSQEGNMSSITEQNPAETSLPEKRKITYADYLNWSGDVRVEIINGIAHMISMPSTIHQKISLRLMQHFIDFLAGKTYQVFTAPFAVRLFPQEDKTDDTIVEPDIVIVCDSAKIDEHGCNGAPDLIIEILSPSSRRKDRYLKRNLYQRAKVREYWIVSPDYNEIEVHLFEGNSIVFYGINEPETSDDLKLPEIVPVAMLPGLEINANDIFNL
jgi:Uma2 family endonuclease